MAVDVSYEWLSFFLESDERLAEIAHDYSSGAMLTGEVKKELIGLLTVSAQILVSRSLTCHHFCFNTQDMVKQHQENRAKVTEEVVRAFMTVRELKF